MMCNFPENFSEYIIWYICHSCISI